MTFSFHFLQETEVIWTIIEIKFRRLPTGWIEKCLHLGFILFQISTSFFLWNGGHQSIVLKVILGNHHRTEELIPPDQLEHIDSIPRIIKRTDFRPHFRLADLEHHATADLLNNPNINCVNAYWQNDLSNRFTANLPLMTRFRKSRAQRNIVCLLDEDGAPYFRVQERAWETPDNPQDALPEFRYQALNVKNDFVKAWLDMSLPLALSELAENLREESLLFTALKYATVTLDENTAQWCFNETLGFWQED